MAQLFFAAVIDHTARRLMRNALPDPPRSQSQSSAEMSHADWEPLLEHRRAPGRTNAETAAGSAADVRRAAPTRTVRLVAAASQHPFIAALYTVVLLAILRPSMVYLPLLWLMGFNDSRIRKGELRRSAGLLSAPVRLKMAMALLALVRSCS